MDHIRTLASWLEDLKITDSSKELYLFRHKVVAKQYSASQSEIDSRAMSDIQIIGTYEKG